MTREIPVSPAARQYIHELWDEIARLNRVTESLQARLASQTELHAEQVTLLTEQLTSFREAIRAHTEASRLAGLIHAADIADLREARKPQ